MYEFGWKHEAELSSLTRGKGFFYCMDETERMRNMGKRIAKELKKMNWGLAGCLLFLGISSPAYHKFYSKPGGVK